MKPIDINGHLPPRRRYCDTTLKKASLFISEVRRPIPLPAGGEARISISVGIALYPQHGTTIEVLCEHADQAMYQVKKGSKNGALVHQDSGSV